jgi:transposase-like protein
MEQYPRTLADLEDRFRSEESCRQYLIELRWPEGYRCVRCASAETWETELGHLMCRSCGYQQSATAGTLFHGSHLSLRTWFRAMWWVTNQKTGVSALGLQRLLGFGSYETAWTWLHKLRRAMVRSGRDRLRGRVEVDETFIGGVDGGGGRRHVGEKALVAMAVEGAGRKIGRIRLRQVADSSGNSLVAFVKEAVELGSTVVTDGWSGYLTLESQGFIHDAHVVQGKAGNHLALSLLPHVHRVASLLKRWLLGTHQGAVSKDHLDYYLDEFTFRFNRRNSRHRGKLFYRLIQQAVTLEPVSLPHPRKAPAVVPT